MSRCMKKEYGIMPREPFKIIRNCSGCGRKMSYGSTGNFRVNANKSQLDVWLIYQCPKCRHTYNLPIYERVRAGGIEPSEYESFLKNDGTAAMHYGLNRAVLEKCRAEIDWDSLEVEYEQLRPEERQGEECGDAAGCVLPGTDMGPDGEPDFVPGTCLTVHNPYDIKIRAERLAADLLRLTRSQVKRMLKEGKLEIEQDAARKITKIRVYEEG